MEKPSYFSIQNIKFNGKSIWKIVLNSVSLVRIENSIFDTPVAKILLGNEMISHRQVYCLC